MILDFLIVFLVTVLVSLVVYFMITGKRPSGNRLIFFLSLLLGTWAGGLWIMPVIRSISRLYWMSFIMVAILYSAVICFLLLPYRRPETRGEALRRSEIYRETNRLLEVTLTVVLIVSGIYIIFHYAK